MTTSNFYRDLPFFSNFNELTDDKHFSALPEDWKVIVADIAGSTKAIEEGRYKDVNTLGAACIVAVQNAKDKAAYTYVFGGDGATMLVPPDQVAKTTAALDGVRALAREQFGMTLRVGMVEVAELYSEGRAIKVAKFQLHAQQCMALFWGEGLTAADAKVKQHPEKHEIQENPDNAGDLTGLSCRWNPIQSQKGKILSLLVAAKSPQPKETYDQVLRQLDAILGEGISRANPVAPKAMQYKSIGQAIDDERRYCKRIFSLAFLRSFIEIIASVLVFKFHFPALSFQAKDYVSSLDTHSDFRKFDEILRMVIDCTPTQIQEIRTLFEDLREKGEINYGLHESDQALMTCFVYGVGDGEHVHFVDGGDGGYAMAAKQFKAQKA